MWHPAHTTTFVLPVFEIEQIISQLNIALRNSTLNFGDSVEIVTQLRKQVSNWETVLSNYRKHNSDLTSMFTVDNIMYLNMAKAYAQWDKGIISDSDLVGAIDGSNTADDDFLGKASADIQSAISSATNAMETAFKGVIKGLTDAFNSIQTIESVFKNIEQTASLIETDVQKATAVIKCAVSTISDVASTISSEVSNIPSEIQSAISSGMDSLATTINSAATAITNAADNIPSEISSATVSGFQNSASGAGNIGQQILRGVENIGNSIGDAFSSWFRRKLKSNDSEWNSVWINQTSSNRTTTQYFNSTIFPNSILGGIGSTAESVASDIPCASQVVDFVSSSLQTWSSLIQSANSDVNSFLTDFASAAKSFGDATAAISTAFQTSESANSLFSDFSNSFQKISDSCGSLIPQYQSDYMKSVCADFNSAHWTGFQSLMNGACALPGTPNAAVNSDGTSANPLSNSVLIQSACQHRRAAQSADMPGGLNTDGKDDSLMGFMTNSDKYLTFGASSPIELSWTTSVSDSKAFTSNLEYSKGKDSSNSVSVGGSLFIVEADGSSGGAQDQSHSFSIGKSSESSHSFERTVGVVLADNDYGS